MKEQALESVGNGTTKIGTTIADLKLRVVEHIVTQTDCHRGDDVWAILAETKIGVRRSQTLLEKLRVVFSTS